MQNELNELQSWYLAQCDGEWEHRFGVTIETLDNPGWQVRIALTGTSLEHRNFTPVEHLAPENTWLRCWVENREFHGAGGPEMLAPILARFLEWARQPT
jgi:hypothetical protein